MKFEDNTKEVLSKFKSGVKNALTAISIKATETTVKQMQVGYGKPIYDSGDLQRDVKAKVRFADNEIDIGSPQNYSLWVHEGTHNMRARPYITDAIKDNVDLWREIAEEYIGGEMK